MDIIKDIKSIPVLRPLLALSGGIVTANEINLPLFYVLPVISVCLLFLIINLLFRLSVKPFYSSLTGFAISIIFLSTGFLIFRISVTGTITELKNPRECFFAEILTQPIVKNGNARFEMFLFPDSSSLEGLKAQCFMRIGENDNLPEAGEYIIVKSIPEKIPGPMNPGEFDYASYLGSKDIFYRCFIKEGEWSKLPGKKHKSFRNLTLRIKKYLWDRIEKQEPGNKNLGVLYALGLGSKELLIPETREAYAASGAMHVLAVSGLHVGLIWLVLSYIFSWARKLPAGKLLQFLLIAVLVWIYAMVTGMSASVVRSAGMFTLVSLGKIIQKESSVYNSLCVSAFFGLLVNPQWIFDAGFQLSYAAVLSIVFFQPRILILFNPSSWLLKKAWDITAVSIAAQFGTLPLSLYYFNRFPPWFIISNLVVIPLITFIMLVFILMILSLAIPLIFAICLKILLFLIGLMTASVKYIETLPSPGMDSIYLSGIQVGFFAITILAMVLFIRYKKFRFILISLASLLCLVSEGSYRKFNSLNNSEMILFSVPGSMVVGFVEGNRGLFLHNAFNDSLVKSSFDFKCKPYLQRNGIRNISFKGLNKLEPGFHDFKRLPGNHNYFIRFHDRSVIILDDPNSFQGMKSKFPLVSDFLIINDRIPWSWNDEKSLFYVNQLIISTSPPRYTQFNPARKSIISFENAFDARISGAFRFRPVLKN